MRFLYSALVGLALLSGCSGIEKKEGLEHIASKSSIVMADVSPQTEKVVEISSSSADEVNEFTLTNHYSQRSLTTIITSKKTADDISHPINLRLYDYLPPYPYETGFDIFQVEYKASLWGQQSSSQSELFLPDSPRYLLGRDVEPEYDNYMPDPIFFMGVGREIVRKLAAKGIKPAQELYHLIIKIEKFGKLAKNFQEAIQRIYTIDIIEIFRDPEIGLNPFSDLEEFVTSPSCESRKKPDSGYKFTLEPTINNHQIDSKIVGKILQDYIKKNKLKLDWGIGIYLRLEW